MDRSKCDVEEGAGVDTKNSKTELDAAVHALTAAREALKATTKKLTKEQAAGPPSKRSDAPRPEEQKPEGLAVTLAAFDNFVEDSGLNFFTAHFAEIFLAVIDLVPVTLKLLSGSPAYEQKRWNRQSRDILDVRNELRTEMKLQAKGYEALESDQARTIVTAAATRVVKLVSQRWVAVEQARANRALEGAATRQPPSTRVPSPREGAPTVPQPDPPAPTVTEDPPWATDPTDAPATDDFRATFVLQQELWAVGPLIAPRSWVQTGTDVRMAARVVNGAEPTRFFPEEDCMAVKLATDVTRLRREFKLEGELDETGCVHVKSEVLLEDQVDELTGFTTGLGYKYYPLTDAERYFAALQSGRLVDPDNTYFRLTEWTRILVEVLRGLEVKHLAHDDIKPRNMLVGGGTKTASGDAPPPKIFLIDWDTVYRYGSPYAEGMGTAQYRAPELVNKTFSPNFATDLYSLGASMFELATGRTPYGALFAQDAALAQADMPHVIRALMKFNPRDYLLAAGAPPTFADLIDSMLQVDPANRPDSEKMRMLANRAVTDVSMKDVPVILTEAHHRMPAEEPSMWGPEITTFLRGCGYELPDWMAHA